MQAVDVSPLKICVHKFPFVDDWRNKFYIDKIQVTTVKRLLYNSHVPEDVRQVSFTSKNGIPETSVYIEGNTYGIRDLFEIWYNSLQIDVRITIPENWNEWKKRQYYPVIRHELGGTQVYRDGRGRSSYFYARHLEINPGYSNIFHQYKEYSNVNIRAKDGSSPLRLHGLKTSMFSLASTVIDEMNKLDQLTNDTVPF